MKERSNVTRDRVASVTRNVSTPGAFRLHEFGKEAVAWARAADRGFLVGREFLHRMGVDAAKGPEEWAFTFVVGSSP